MNYLKDLLVELAAALIILAVVGVVLYAGLTALNDLLVRPVQLESAPPKDLRPVIAQCDKELWDRVRGEC